MDDGEFLFEVTEVGFANRLTGWFPTKQSRCDWADSCRKPDVQIESGLMENSSVHQNWWGQAMREPRPKEEEAGH